MITPAEIKTKAKSLYASYVKEWLAGEDIPFPLRVPANLKLHDNNMAADIRAIEALRARSKEAHGWGYRVEERQIDSPVHGSNQRPVAIWIDTPEDLLWLCGKQNEFQRFKRMVEKLRQELPALEPWIQKSYRQLPREWWMLNGAIQVAKYLMENPRPDCYPQQLPVEVDTKFISRHETMLRGWLNELLPSSAILSHESRFAQRFGFRESLQTRTVYFLDSALQAEAGLPFDEFDAPLRSLAALELVDAVVVVVENKAPLTCVPPIPRGLVLSGQGNNALALKDLPWLADNRVLYWGDIDAAGYEILCDFRRRVPHTESILMDAATYEAHKKYSQKCKQPGKRELTYLTEPERQMHRLCVEKNVRLEQEKLGQKHVCNAFLDAVKLPVGDADTPTAETELPDTG